MNEMGITPPSIQSTGLLAGEINDSPVRTNGNFKFFAGTQFGELSARTQQSGNGWLTKIWVPVGDDNGSANGRPTQQLEFFSKDQPYLASWQNATLTISGRAIDDRFLDAYMVKNNPSWSARQIEAVFGR
jgi:hypothetical protein